MNLLVIGFQFPIRTGVGPRCGKRVDGQLASAFVTLMRVTTSPERARLGLPGSSGSRRRMVPRVESASRETTRRSFVMARREGGSTSKSSAPVGTCAGLSGTGLEGRVHRLRPNVSDIDPFGRRHRRSPRPNGWEDAHVLTRVTRVIVVLPGGPSAISRHASPGTHHLMCQRGPRRLVLTPPMTAFDPSTVGTPRGMAHVGRSARKPDHG